MFQKISRSLCCLPFFFFSVHAANFQISEFGAVPMGTANAGTAVLADPSVQYFNPAAMPLIHHQVLSIATTVIAPKISFNPTLMLRGGVDHLAGSTAESPAQDAFVPMFYYVQPLKNRRMHWGVSLTVPYAMQTKYAEDAASRYFATHSSITALNLNPAGSYQWIPGKLSVGFGLNLQHLEADLNSMFAAGIHDIDVKNEGSALEHGWNVGVLFRPMASVRLGVSQRSRISQHVRGKTRVEGDPAATAVAAGLGIADGPAKINFTLPEMTILSAAYQMSPKWQILGDLQITHWHRIQALDLFFGPQQRKKSILTRYKNTHRWAIGSSYQYDPRWQLRAGYAQDHSPVSSQYRRARIPDNDRIWYSFGISYRYSKPWQFDLAYSHIAIRDATIKEFDPVLDHRLNAHYTAQANLYAAQVAYYFT